MAGKDVSYFEFDADKVSSETGLFVDWEKDVEAVEFLPGLEFQPVVGRGVMVSFVRFAPHTEAPVHAHDEEQITFVVEGEFEFEVAGEKRTMRAGQAAIIPPNVPHGARTGGSPCLEVDVFVPPRKALLQLLEHPGEE